MIKEETKKERKYGIFVCEYNGYELLRAKNDVYNNESDITKRAKEILKRKYNLIEELAIWNNKGQRIAVFDLYNIEKNWGIELVWSQGRKMKKLEKQLMKYKPFCKKLSCIFLKDSTRRRTNRYYSEWKQKRIRNLGIAVSILDVKIGAEYLRPSVTTVSSGTLEK